MNQMKKIFILLSLFFFFAIPIRAQVNSNESINSFDEKININKDGTIDVKENIAYDFSNLQKHGIYRIIPYTKTNQDGKKYQLSFSNFEVKDDEGVPYQFTKTTDEKNITLKIGDANLIVSGKMTYVISYMISGAITYYSDHDELYWNATGNSWNVPIKEVSTTINWPEEINARDIKTTCFTGPVGGRDSNCSFENGIFKGMGELAPGEGMTVVFGFPKNVVSVVEPKEYVPFSETFLGKLVAVLLVLLGIFWYALLPFLIVFLWFKKGRDPRPKIGEVAAWYDPPKSPVENRFLTPGEVGTLGDETADIKDVSATIVDLARRGFLKIEERKKDDFYLVRKKTPTELLEYENVLLEKFFKEKSEIRIKDEKLYQEVEEVKSSLYKQVVDVDKLFPTNPQTIRTFYYVIAFIGFLTGNLPLAFISFIFGRIMPRKTQAGSDAYSVSKSLKNFLSTQERQLEFQANKQLMFEKLLPYAIVFGVEKIWAKRFQTLNIKAPSWYSSYDRGTFNSFIFVSSLNSSMRSFQTAATPTRSSSGFSSGFGGGFSGGGGGGGGGGSW